jgi:hypothetical protein
MVPPQHSVGAPARWHQHRGASALHTAVPYWHHHPPPPAPVAGPCHAACLQSMWRQVLFGQLRGTRPVGSPPVTLRGLMRKDVLLLNGGGGQVHGRRWYQQCIEKAAWWTSVDSVL